MGKTSTASEAAKQLGCSIATISRWAARLGFQKRYGNALVLSLKEIRQIDANRNTERGNPSFLKQKA
jgi:DNA-binding MurR/RpiR family transcriptional regulator